jgi:Fe-S-cluster containining protein
VSATLRTALPPIYANLLSRELDRPAIAETRATCDDCEMCDKGTMPPEAAAIYFLRDTKCCTYHPALPNYLVGSILRDRSPDMADGQRRIRERIASRIGVGPLRLAPSAKYLLLYRASSVNAFGRSASLRCPYLTDDARCSIWRHRESICSTFFCKFEGGQPSVLFWRALKEYLSYVEIALSRWAVRTVAKDVVPFTSEETELTLEELEDRPPTDDVYAKAWGSWLGREEELYLACESRVRNLSPAQFASIVDDTATGRERLDELRSRYAATTSWKVPERLALHKKLRRLPVASGIAVTTPYNRYDSMLIDKDLFGVLERFRHEETVEEIRRRLAEEEGIELTEELLLHLSRHLVLAEPPRPEAPMNTDG